MKRIKVELYKEQSAFRMFTPGLADIDKKGNLKVDVIDVTHQDSSHTFIIPIHVGKKWERAFRTLVASGYKLRLTK